MLCESGSGQVSGLGISNNGAPGMSWLGPWSMQSSTLISCRNWTACSTYHGPCSTPTLLKRLCRAVVVTPDPDGVVLLSRIELGWLLRSGKQMADQVGVALGKTWVWYHGARRSVGP